jgi:uncharacterized protein (UPF0179 family)
MNLVKFDEEWIDIETGQIFTKKQLEKLNNKRLFDEHNTYLSNTIDLEVGSKYKLTKIREKESPTKVVKEGYKFNMMHRTDLKELMLSNELTVYESAFIGKLTPFITFPDNSMRIKNEYLTLDELSKFCGFSKNIMTKTIKSLEKIEVIKVVKGGNKPPIIYFNPFLYSAGREVTNDTFDMFCKSKYNPDIAHYQ